MTSSDAIVPERAADLMNGLQQKLLFVGLLLVAVALCWPILSKIGIGRLPGDIFIKRENFTFYFLLTTMILVSILVTVFLRLLQK